MREILFRGKATENYGKYKIGDWIYGNFVEGMNKNDCCINPKRTVHHIQVDPETVGQYIGLKDNKQERIFEGDIFKLSTWYGEDFGIVHWDEERAEFYVETKKDFYDMVAIPSETEIVGNMWDNPELWSRK